MTITTNQDDNAQLLKSNKKKKNLFKNLFHFGSKKGRSKSMEPSANHSKDHSDKTDDQHNENNDESSENIPKQKHSQSDYNRKYQLEQDRIKLQYQKLLEERRWKQQQEQKEQQISFVRNQLHPMHQSMPLSRNHFARNHHKNFSPQSQNHVYATSPRDTVGVPQPNTKNDKIAAYLRSNQRVHPEQRDLVYNDNQNV